MLSKCLLPMRHVNATTVSVHERIHAPVLASAIPLLLSPMDRNRATFCRILDLVSLIEIASFLGIVEFVVTLETRINYEANFKETLTIGI